MGFRNEPSGRPLLAPIVLAVSLLAFIGSIVFVFCAIVGLW
jgi:hypothetical protein